MTINTSPAPGFPDPTITPTPPLFCKENRPIWDFIRRFLVGFIRMIDEAYRQVPFDK
jgi:hypothetical protein